MEAIILYVFQVLIIFLNVPITSLYLIILHVSPKLKEGSKFWLLLQRYILSDFFLNFFKRRTTGGKPRLSSYFGSGETMENFTLTPGSSQTDSPAQSIKPRTSHIFLFLLGSHRLRSYLWATCCGLYYQIWH